MDPSLSDVSQQKTSPNSDPAALMQLTSELTAQASQLASLQHQLQRLTTLTEELVTALQGLRITQPQTAANPPPASANPPTMQIPSVSPRLAFPERFDGDSTRCKGFLLQCSLFVNQQPSLYPTESSRIAFVCLTEPVILQIGTLHSEEIQFYVIQSPTHPLILGLSWLRTHGPQISWREGQITEWGPACQERCLSKITRKLNTVTTPTVDTLNLPREYADLIEVFSKKKASQLPAHRSVDCAIDLLPGTTPPKGRIFPMSQPESESMKAYIQEELAKGFIRPSTSPASAGFFFVKKKDGGLRPCIDYRGLNENTVKFRYPLPLVPAALEQLRQAKYYTKLDLRNAYNLIRIREGDEWKTAFSTTSGHYEYLVMPFGLANSPSVFQAFMNDIFRDMLDRWVIVYIDDILIYSDTQEEHIRHVRSVLKRLLQHQLYVKAEKCEFHRTNTSFLGYVISQDGVSMDDKKVQAVLDWPQPQTVKELQCFLGFANFYRRFIRNFSSIASPLTAMTKRNTSRLVCPPRLSKRSRN